MRKYIFISWICMISTLPAVAQTAKGVAAMARNAKPTAQTIGKLPYITPLVRTRVATSTEQQILRAMAVSGQVGAMHHPTAAGIRTPGKSGYLYVGIPAEGFTHEGPMVKRNPLHKRYPSGLLDEEQLISDWLEYFKNGYFRPRDQVEAIEGMSPVKMNNIIEYLYPMSLEEAKEIILNPLRETGRLPDFMYDDKLIPGTKRLPARYYKNKFNENIKTFVQLAQEDGSIFTHNVQLKELVSTLKDYTFAQGFTYTNSPELTRGLRQNWEALMAQIRKPGVTGTNRALINELWTKPVLLPDGKTVSLKEYFTQTRKTAFFDAAIPEFYLNSPKWVALENQRRNLIANEYPFVPEEANLFNQLQKKWALGHPEQYLTLEQFGQLMTAPYEGEYGQVRAESLANGAVSSQLDAQQDLKALVPTSTTIKINNFDKLGGVCQMSFGDGGYMGRIPAGYDGTTTINRFEPVVFDNIRVVTFDMNTLRPRVVTLDKVSYVKDLKNPDIDKVRASSMVGDGLDASRDVLTVQLADKALHNIPHLRATIYPQSRVSNADQIPYMKGGGLAAYLALFTPDFYPVKTIRLLKQVDGKWQWVPTHFIRKEIVPLAGFVHRAHLTFTEQVADRIVDNAAE